METSFCLLQVHLRAEDEFWAQCCTTEKQARRYVYLSYLVYTPAAQYIPHLRRDNCSIAVLISGGPRRISPVEGFRVSQWKKICWKSISILITAHAARAGLISSRTKLAPWIGIKRPRGHLKSHSAAWLFYRSSHFEKARERDRERHTASFIQSSSIHRERSSDFSFLVHIGPYMALECTSERRQAALPTAAAAVDFVAKRKNQATLCLRVCVCDCAHTCTLARTSREIN